MSMRGIFLLLGWPLASVLLAEEIPRAVEVAEPLRDSAAARQDEVVSRSEQFRISGGDQAQRATIAVLAEETKDELLKLIEPKDRDVGAGNGPSKDDSRDSANDDKWKVPIRIRLHGKEGDPMPPRTMSLRRRVVEGVNDLQLDIHMSRGIENERFKRMVTSALIYERALRTSAGKSPDAALFVPPWVSDGMREASAWRMDQGNRRLYEALFRSGGVLGVDELFDMNDTDFDSMDAATRAAFRVASGALVMALLEQPQGVPGFRDFLTEVATHQGETPNLLRKHFPEMNLSETSLEKWWALQLASKGGLNLLTDIMNIQQTETALAEALLLNVRTAEGILEAKDLSAWQEVAALEEVERQEAVRIAQDSLVHLSFRCFPSYRPMLQDYQTVLDSIAKGKTRGVAAKLASLDEVRETMILRAARGRDYMDYFEITRARETSGAFDDYLRLKEGLEENPHRRKDSLSQYLDRMDRIFHREEKKALWGQPR